MNLDWVNMVSLIQFQMPGQQQKVLLVGHHHHKQEVEGEENTGEKQIREIEIENKSIFIFKSIYENNIKNNQLNIKV